VGKILKEVGGDLLDMAEKYRPTFFVVAFSARVSQSRVARARMTLENQLGRHCHILDRHQVEGLICDNLGLLDEIFRECLTREEIQEVRSYFENRTVTPLPHLITVDTPEKVLAGVPFRVTVRVRSSVVCGPPLCLWWKPGPADASPQAVRLIGPLGADLPIGAELEPDDTVDDPIYSWLSMELETHAVGRTHLGEVRVGLRADGESSADRAELRSILVVENVRPRFFMPPFLAGLTRLSEVYEQARTGDVLSVGVVGAGGSGKSRLCEEFALEQRRGGARLVSAKQAKTLDDPYRILANLLMGLTQEEILIAYPETPLIADPAVREIADPAGRVVQTISLYEPALASVAESTIRSIMGADHGMSGTVSESAILSAIVLLIVVRARCSPLIVHFQDLHWCSPDMLKLLDQLVWQFDPRRSSSGGGLRGSHKGILFIFEGRMQERGESGRNVWTSEPFEAFLQKLDCQRVQCSSFTPDDGLKFATLLFEGRHSAGRLVSDDLLDLQGELIASISRTAGGNPFHCLQQVQFLKERRVLGQNPETGLLYMIQPGQAETALPDEVFDSIRLRWQYLQERSPQVALLLWAAALLEDQIPRPLFDHLRRDLAPDVDLDHVDATDFLWTGSSSAADVVFRHEHYFHALRRFEVSSGDHRRVVDSYSDWYRSVAELGPNDQFKWTRVLLEHPEPDVVQVRKLLRTALESARRLGDVKLARRVAAAALDLAWSQDGLSPAPLGEFLNVCDGELELVRDLLGSDRVEAQRRLGRLQARLIQRVATLAPDEALRALELRQLTTEVVLSQFLFNDRQAVRASEVAAHAVREIGEGRLTASARDAVAWQALEMEALHAQSVALALSGEIERALQTSERAVKIARTSSTVLARHVISTYANILLAREPAASEAILRQCLADMGAANGPEEPPRDIEINLSMALVLQAHRLGGDDAKAASFMLEEAARRLNRVFKRCYALGNFPEAAAAALMRGIVSVLTEEHEEIRFFAYAVAAASRGHQMETLWRARINLAQALHRGGEHASASPHDHARAAFEILEETLRPYSEPDLSPRFRLIRVPLAHAVRILILSGDDTGLRALERYPALRACFADPTAGVLRDDRGGYTSHEWLRVAQDDYVIY
jgi:hypothetical protein